MIDSFDENYLNKSLLFLSVGDNDSLFAIFWDRIRNAIAHGGINCSNNRYILINQIRPKQESPLNFLLQTNCAFDEEIGEIWGCFCDFLLKPREFKYKCLENELSLNGEYYSKSLGRFVIIDDEFRYNSAEHKKEIHDLILKYEEKYKKADIIISENQKDYLILIKDLSVNKK